MGSVQALGVPNSGCPSRGLGWGPRQRPRSESSTETGWKLGRGTLTSKRARELGARAAWVGRERIARQLLPVGRAEGRAEGARKSHGEGAGCDRLCGRVGARP